MFDPDGRTWFKVFRFSLRVGAQAERVVVIIANNPLGLPGDKDFGAFLTEVRIPAAPDQQGWGFQEVSVRKGDFALVGIAATLKVENGKIVGATVAACGVGQRARRLRAAEAALTRAVPGKDAFSEAGEAAVAALDPHFGVHADAAYRRDLVRTLTARALSDAAERAA